MSKTTPTLHSQSFICVNPRHPSRVSSTLSSKILPFPRKPLQGWNFSCKVEAFHGLSIQEGSRKQRDGVDVAADDDAPVSVALEPISSETHFDRVLADAQQLDEALVIVWYFSDFVLQWIGRGIASWCRKCIYLKPKLEKLAADYYPRVRFYRVDVNSVPHKLVARAGVTKMPTIQLWKDGKKQAEVIGGHKGYLVVNEVRDMIENEPTTL